MILTKHFMMTARLECTDRWPAPHLYFKRLSHPGWLPSDGATPKPAHSKLEYRKRGRNRKSSLWCIFLNKSYVSFLTIVHLFTVRFLPMHLNSWREFLRALCHRLWRKGAHLPLSRHPSERSGWDTQ